MRINLENNYVIVDDANSYKLFQVTGQKEDKKTKTLIDIEKVICYPSTIEYAIKRYAREMSIDYEGDLKGYIDKMSEIISNVTKGL